MGATTYRLMSGLAADGEPGTDVLADLPKVVFSSTLTEPLSWPNTQLVTQDPVEAVQQMKDNGSAMRTLGSLMLCRFLLKAGLVDRFRVGGGGGLGWWPPLALVAYGGIALIGLALSPVVGAVLASLTLMAHGVWDVIHYRRNAVVSRSLAEACIAFDVLLGLAAIVLVAATA